MQYEHWRAWATPSAISAFSRPLSEPSAKVARYQASNFSQSSERSRRLRRSGTGRGRRSNGSLGCLPSAGTWGRKATRPERSPRAGGSFWRRSCRRPSGAESPRAAAAGSRSRGGSLDPSWRFISIGFIGLGVMGKPMAKNLLAAGFDLTVHSRSPGPVDELAAAGARRAESPAGCAGGRDAVILMLPDSPDSELVMLRSRRGSARGGPASAGCRHVFHRAGRIPEDRRGRRSSGGGLRGRPGERRGSRRGRRLPRRHGRRRRGGLRSAPSGVRCPRRQRGALRRRGCGERGEAGEPDDRRRQHPGGRGGARVRRPLRPRSEGGRRGRSGTASPGARF